jgi:hypothetical protein
MTIQEAILSGKPFYRTKSTYYFIEKNKITGVKQIKQIYKSGKKEYESHADFSLTDLLSNNWEIKDN